MDQQSLLSVYAMGEIQRNFRCYTNRRPAYITSAFIFAMQMQHKKTQKKTSKVCSSWGSSPVGSSSKGVPRTVCFENAYRYIGL